MRFNTFIFDLDGPLLDGKNRHYQCYLDILKQLNCPAVDIETYWQLKRQRKTRLEQLALSSAESHYDNFLRLWLERIEEKNYLDLDVLQNDALTTLTYLQQQGKCLILATLRKNIPNLYEQLNRLAIHHFFQHIIAIDSQRHTDKAAAVQAIINNQDKSSYLWIGDTEIDYQAAAKLDIPVALVSNGLRTSEYLATLAPQFLARNLSEIISWCDKS